MFPKPPTGDGRIGTRFIRCYNAAMDKPFQFSLRRMLCAVACFCFSAALFSYLLHDKFNNLAAPIILITLAFAGAGGRGGIHRWPPDSRCIDRRDDWVCVLCFVRARANCRIAFSP